MIFAHNHPSGVAQPSQADELLTRNLKEALALVDVKVLDHFIVAGNQAISFAERGVVIVKFAPFARTSGVSQCPASARSPARSR